MNRCINCGIATNRCNTMGRRALDDENILSVIRQWRAPQFISSSDHVCQACWDLAQRSPLGEPRHLGHRTVCLRCGCSLASRIRHLLHTGSPRELRIYNVIQKWIKPGAIEVASHICHTCWVAADRATVHMVSSPLIYSQPSPIEEIQPQGQELPQCWINPYTDSTESPQMEFEEDSCFENTSMTEIGNEDSTTKENEIIVFCPTCNTEVSRTAEGIQEDQTKILIAKVYHYFEQEYEELKKVYEDIDLTPLSKFRLRTALATGVTETKVLQILKEEEERSAAKREVTPQKRRRARKRPRQTDSSSEEDNSDDNNDDGENSSDDHEADMLNVKAETEDNEEPEIYLESAHLKGDSGDGEANKELADPISVDVKIEPADDETDNTSPTLTLNAPADAQSKGRMKRRKSDVTPTHTNPILALNAPADTPRKERKKQRKSDVTPTQQHSQGDSSTTAASSSVRRAEELYESSLLGESELKMEEIEILEEGFS